ncbi:hypothetical protein FVEG_14690 [Fusarium verticillioides 7600]|uniref:Uncharacterized protein n=1 Tax=Gibberella moniliformis (strain M3125 / FGSC 7600) TaxID=334819 RepID=W7LML2_GIBM7|nr:hypothetical protein FVEG_14690 [Fusarium verticillioides 7600]EWG36659.1 hypothetical protein FVEG_14690 [Fusarium verticillioides 7600]
MEMLWIALATARTETPGGRTGTPHSFAEHCRGGGGQEMVSMVSSRNVTPITLQQTPKDRTCYEVVSERFKGRTELSSKPVSSNATPDHITFMPGNDLTEPRGRTGMCKQCYPERSSYNIGKCYTGRNKVQTCRHML